MQRVARRREVQAASESGKTVTVACKLPHGFQLKVYDMVETGEVTPHGYKAVKMAQQRGETIMIRGWWTDFQEQNARRRSAVPPPAAEGTYALTFGVPADVWDKWLEDNKDSALVKNRIVFAHQKLDHVEGLVDDNEKTRSGLEPVDPDRPPSDVKNVKRAKKDDEDDEDDEE